MNSQKVHIGLNVSDVERSVNFYRAMFGSGSGKVETGLREVRYRGASPQSYLELSGKVSNMGALNHLGIEVQDTAQVLAAKKRFAEAGLATVDEMNVDCCFALQDKVWITDPDGNRWEIFTVKIGDTRPELNATDKANSAKPSGCCQATTC